MNPLLQPRCGFTRQLLEILNERQVKYSSFNILSDEDVRQGTYIKVCKYLQVADVVVAGLKAYSNWPTYPQMYIKGELIGGLDIVKELAASGELAELIQEANQAAWSLYFFSSASFSFFHSTIITIISLKSFGVYTHLLLHNCYSTPGGRSIRTCSQSSSVFACSRCVVVNISRLQLVPGNVDNIYPVFLLYA